MNLDFKSWYENHKRIVFDEKNNYSFTPELTILVFGFLICIVALITTADLNLYGHKSEAIFDIWNLVHISSGAIISFILIGLRKIDLHHPILFLLLLTSTWEILEHYLETIGPTLIANWFAGTEHLLNRLIGDQISVILGFAIIKSNPKLLPITFLILISLLLIHIFVGSSMYFY